MNEIQNKSYPLNIKIINELQMILPVQHAASAYSAMLGFNKKECYQIELLIEEIISNIIKYDFIPGQKEYINIYFEKSTLGLSIIIHSNCIPLDIDRIKSFENVNKENIIKHNASGLGTLFINKFADSLTYANKGKNGQYIYIEKYLDKEELSYNKESEIIDSKLSVFTNFEFYIRRLKPEEAPIISKLAYYTYNLSYIYDKVYYPELVRKLNEQNEMISIVAVNKENEDIIGHVAAITDNLSGMQEMAVAFVNPQYRGGGCLNKLSENLLNLLNSQQLPGVIVHAVTTHFFSQKAAHNLNLKESALFISRLTPLSMNEIKDNDSDRETLILMFISFCKNNILEIFVPKHHTEIIKKIYKHLDISYRIIDIDTQSSYSINSKYDNDLPEITVINDNYNCSHLYINKYANNTKDLIEKTLKSLCIHKIDTVYLYLPLDCMESSLICADFEKLNFFFGGIVPNINGKHYLMLQYLNNQIYNYSNINIYDEFTKELLEYIRVNDPNQNI